MVTDVGMGAFYGVSSDGAYYRNGARGLLACSKIVFDVDDIE